MVALSRHYRDLLASYSVVTGSDMTSEFEARDVADPIEKVIAKWETPGRDPVIGEIAWSDVPT